MGMGENIFCPRACHLTLLQIRDPALWIKNENVHSFLPRETMNRSRSGITGRCTEHIDRFAGALDLVFEKISYQLQPKVFERQGSAHETIRG